MGIHQVLLFIAKDITAPNEDLNLSHPQNTRGVTPTDIFQVPSPSNSEKYYLSDNKISLFFSSFIYLPFLRFPYFICFSIYVLSCNQFPHLILLYVYI